MATPRGPRGGGVRRSGSGSGRPPVAPFRRRLLAWYERERRDLPWRGTREPYPVWISEVLLQQTTVAVGVPRWKAFLARFPDLESLAAASPTEVLAAWSGLGYYARARNLHRAARLVASRGSFPRSARELSALPGIGPYTAAAIASICFDEPVAVVDGNVVRVISRLLALPAVAARGADRETVRAEATALLSPSRPGDFNQALMELGATVCLPRSPRCGACPVAAWCAAHADGREEAFPLPAPRKPSRRLTLAAGVAWRGGRLVLVPDRHLVPGHLVVPLVVPERGESPAEALARGWSGVAGRRCVAAVPRGTVSHAVLDRRYTVVVLDVVEGARAPEGPSRPRLVAPDGLTSVPRGGLLGKVLALSGPPGRAPRGAARRRPRGG